MGKTLIQQRRGKGSPTYRARRKAFNIKICYPIAEGSGKVIKLLSIAGFTAPISMIKIGNQIFYNPASQGLEEGQEIQIGENAQIMPGNIVPLKNTPIGTNVFNIEIRPHSGGQLVRSSGLSAQVTKRTKQGVYVMLPSKKEKLLNENARVTLGTIAGGGRVEKPFVKAGKKWYLMRARNKLWPRTSPIKMNALCHPFGSGRGKNIGKSTVPPRNAPPGRKVGLLRARHTGRNR